jgi:hypothetical protein
MNRILVQSLALVLLTGIVAWVTLGHKAHRTTPHTYTLTAAVSQSGSPASPTFTFQGVFSDPQTGSPIDGPTNIRIGIGDGPADNDPIVSLTEASPSYTSGRFTAEVDLMDPQGMLNIADPHIVLLSADGTDTPLIPRIPIRYTPYAWTAEYAREAVVAQEADVAQEAELSDFATTALTADALAGSSSTPLATEGSWVGELRADRIGSLVVLSGRAITSTNGTFVTTLPEGYRPSTTLYFSVMGGGSTNQQPLEARVQPDGNVFVDTTNAALDAANLDGMVFVVGP